MDRLRGPVRSGLEPRSSKSVVWIGLVRYSGARNPSTRAGDSPDYRGSQLLNDVAVHTLRFPTPVAAFVRSTFPCSVGFRKRRGGVDWKISLSRKKWWRCRDSNPGHR